MNSLLIDNWGDAMGAGIRNLENSEIEQISGGFFVFLGIPAYYWGAGIVSSSIAGHHIGKERALRDNRND